jgi:hypothetical protein
MPNSTSNLLPPHTFPKTIFLKPYGILVENRQCDISTEALVLRS